MRQQFFLSSHIRSDAKPSTNPNPSYPSMQAITCGPPSSATKQGPPTTFAVAIHVHADNTIRVPGRFIHSLHNMAPIPKRTALVTGATGLLGREITAAFRQSPGWTVKGTGHSRADGVDVLKLNLENEDVTELNKILDETRYAPRHYKHCVDLDTNVTLVHPKCRPQVIVHCTLFLAPANPCRT